MDCLTITGGVMLTGMLFAGFVGVGTEWFATKLGYKPTNHLAKWRAARDARTLIPTAA